VRCQTHDTDGCGTCRPAMHAAWTAGQLKAALADLPDNTPVAVRAVDGYDPQVCDEQVITGAGFGTVDWGDGYGPEQSKVFGLDCEIPEDQLETRPDRPLRPGTSHRSLSLQAPDPVHLPSPGARPRQEPEAEP
jgi:hypothetical protein